MRRADALEHLTAFNKLAAATGHVTTDTAAGYKPAIDNALRAVGVAEDDLPHADVPGKQVLGFLAVLKMYVAEIYMTELAPEVDTSIDQEATVDKKRSQYFKQAASLHDFFYKEAAKHGLAPGQEIQHIRFRIRDTAKRAGEL